MKKEIFWILISGIIIALQITTLLVIWNPQSEVSYRYEFITLNNTNIFEYWDVVDYLCDDDVKVDNHRFLEKAFYASTWTGSGITGDNYGSCYLKIKEGGE